MALTNSTSRRVADWFKGYTGGDSFEPSAPQPNTRGILASQSDTTFSDKAAEPPAGPYGLPVSGILNSENRAPTAPPNMDDIGASGAAGQSGTSTTKQPGQQSVGGPYPAPTDEQSGPTPPKPPGPPQFAAPAAGIPQSNFAGGAPTKLDPATLTRRVIDPDTETVQGQQIGILNDNSPYVQGFRDRAQRAANARGLSNSTMAASAGEEAAANASLPVAQADAGIYGAAAGYNTALDNQTLMYNVDQQNQFTLQANTIAGQMAIANISAASAANVAGINAAAQLSAAQLSAENQRFIAQMNSETSRYNTDQNYRAEQDRNRTTLVNNIINNMDLSPDRKRELLSALGQGGLANAIFVQDDELISNGGFREGDARQVGGQPQIWHNGRWEVNTLGQRFQ
jgi:hypothetical protein